MQSNPAHTWTERHSGRSAVRLAHLLWEQGVTGSNPVTPTVGKSREHKCVSLIFYGVASSPLASLVATVRRLYVRIFLGKTVARGHIVPCLFAPCGHLWIRTRWLVMSFLILAENYPYLSCNYPYDGKNFSGGACLLAKCGWNTE